MNFYARPNQFLIEHLHNVSKNMVELACSLPISFSDIELKVLRYIGLFHDFGKFTTYFQKKLKGEKTHYSSHSYLSSIFCGVYLYLEKTPPQYIISAMMGIEGHHSALSYFEKLVPITISSESLSFEEIFYEHREFIYQFKDIKSNWGDIVLEFQKIGVILSDEIVNEEIIMESLSYIVDGYIRILEEGKDDKREKIALKTQLYFSLLVDSDQKDAACIENPQRLSIPENIVNKYLENVINRNLEINKIRMEFYKAVEKNIYNNQIIKNFGKVYTLTAPTGIGKTLAVLNFALKLRNLIYKEHGYLPRIIYSLPFISIIDQVSKVLDEVFSLISDYKEKKNEYLLPYHHLSSYHEKDSESDFEEDFESDKILLFDTWQSEVIVTTFWQIVHTILGYKSKNLKRFHTLAGSIIILDEIQSIPIEKFDLIEKFIGLVAEQMGAIFIFMTATQPLFKHLEPIELNAIFEKTFSIMDRTKLKKMFNVKSLEDLLNIIDLNDKSALFVFNTIPQSIENYRKLKGICDQRKVFYLSTNITPKERIKRIGEIKALLEKKEKPILISTQVVEAGVDLDFDVVFREIGPIHSILQAAGRSNRNYINKNVSSVYITNFDESAGKRVYGAAHIVVSNNILKIFEGEISEKNYKDLVKHFFEELQKYYSSGEFKEIINAYRNLEFNSKITASLSDFKLIDEKPSVSIFVILDEDDEEIFSLFEEILNSKDYLFKRKMYLKYRREIEGRIINIPLERAKKNLPPAVNHYESIRFINRDSLLTYYDLETGFKFSETKGDALIW
ncbi:CRISPR-associated helicase Cas3' [Thermosipho ferrireducens]|uniref:CRISPR-associated helicase Cas3 n=1 Tax=Thermosipho ferrireducens TaxID=2571116 RepID=A0ABX7S5T9_9BACT|nr:CRISPR-associated helicase Cas3' [Thermosipho ferrireducens]QTA37931.1 CRISPR-associated helicase Cas3' [Thermosipho ferrireducens]